MKKFIITLIGVLLISTATYAAENCSPWAKDTIDRAISENIVPEKLQSDYTRKITRKEFCTLAVKAYMSKTGYTMQKGLKTPFTDVADDYVTTAYMLDIVAGVGNEKFNPDGFITRQEAAVMLDNLAMEAGIDNTEVNNKKFVDESYFADWAKKPIYRVSAIDSKGTAVMAGTGSGKFSPWMNYTREQAIATVYRLYQCEGIPVLIPQADNNVYYPINLGHSYIGASNIYKIDTTNNIRTEVFPVGENSAIQAVSGNKIYYISKENTGESSTPLLTKSILYSINTDGAEKVRLTPDTADIYLGRKYIYYVPDDSVYHTVVRTWLDGTHPITVDFSGILEKQGIGYANVNKFAKDYMHNGYNYGDQKRGECVILGERNNKLYVEQRIENEAYRVYSYDFTTDTFEKLPYNTRLDYLAVKNQTDGKYIYYMSYGNGTSYMYELHKCKLDGTEDVILNKATDFRDAYIYEGKLYFTKENSIYVHDGEKTEALFTEEVTDINADTDNIEEPKYLCLLSVNNGKIYYNLSFNQYDNLENAYYINIDGTGKNKLDFKEN